MTNGMNGKVILVTGATSGIGKVTALELARQGAVTVIVSRNEQKCAATVDRIRRETGNPDAAYIVADLSSMDQVREAARQFRQRYNRLDVLVNNAGGVFSTRQVTVDGFELTFALNHLSHFLLTNLLLDMLVASAPARIVSVSSDVHRGATIAFDDLQSERRYRAFPVYGRSKLMNVLFTYELARRLQGTGVTANALHPGFVATGFAMNNGMLWKAGAWVAQRFALSLERGAQTSIYLASSPEVDGVTGKYFEKSKPVKSSAASYDEATMMRLWNVSAQLAGLTETAQA